MKEPNEPEKTVLVATGLGFRVNLEALNTLGNAKCEPAYFPGLIYRMDGTVIILFGTGKLVCTGRKKGDIEQSINSLKAMPSHNM